MTPSYVWLLAFLIGVIAGLRSLTAPAAVSWAAHRNWIDLHNSALSFMGSTAAMVVFMLLAPVSSSPTSFPTLRAARKPRG